MTWCVESMLLIDWANFLVTDSVVTCKVHSGVALYIGE